MDDVFCTALSDLVGQMYMHINVFERKKKGYTFSLTEKMKICP